MSSQVGQAETSQNSSLINEFTILPSNSKDSSWQHIPHFLRPVTVIEVMVIALCLHTLSKFTNRIYRPLQFFVFFLQADHVFRLVSDTLISFLRMKKYLRIRNCINTFTLSQIFTSLFMTTPHQRMIEYVEPHYDYKPQFLILQRRDRLQLASLLAPSF